MTKFAPLIFLAACHSSSAPTPIETKSIESSSPIIDASTPSADLRIDASVAMEAGARSKCAEPTHLVQLGTIHEPAMFVGEVLSGDAHSYDPKTLATSAPLPKQTWSPKVGRYDQVVGDFGLVSASAEEAQIENVHTQQVIVTAPMCDSASGSWGFSISTTGRFLLCSVRGGTATIELRPAHGSVSNDWRKSVGLGEDELLAPNDRYSVKTPILDRISRPTGTSIVRRDLDSGKIVVLLPAPKPTFGAPATVAFCGSGEIFVAAGENEIVVFRGDGTRLASAPAMVGGRVSFSASGRYVSQTRGDATTVFRLDF